MCVFISQGEEKVGKHSAGGRPTGGSLRFSAAMFPAVSLLPLMLLAALSSESAATQSDTSIGKTFYVVFPENIAHYHPVPPTNQIQITAIHNDTEVEIKQDTGNAITPTMHAGESHTFTLDARLELGRANLSTKILEITSNNDIIVQAISKRKHSMQTVLVIPTEKLGKKYLIPPIPEIQGSTSPNSVVTTLVTERGPFKLIIVNGDQQNTVTVKGTVTKEVTLLPKQVAQILVEKSDALRVVEAVEPVAVLFSHPCAMYDDCTCGLLYTMLSPANNKMQKFFIPSDFDDESKILLSETGSARIEAFSPNSPLFQIAGTAVLYHPKLLLTLIPEKDFACCYVVTPIKDMENFVLIVVHKDQTEGVHVGSDPVQGSDWQELKGTDYVSKKISVQHSTPSPTLPPTPPLQQTSTSNSVIWHASSKMAVYFVGQDENNAFGHPAPIISKYPDIRGCVLKPGVTEIGKTADGWRESLKYCRDKDMEMLCFSDAKLQEQEAKKVSEANIDSLQEVWIGMRRSSLTGMWYFVNKDPINDTNWLKDEPLSESTHQCVLMDLKSDEDFGWRSEDCCKAFHPVCFRDPEFLDQFE